MIAQVKVETEKLSYDDWLSERQKGIGGSDIAAIVGLSKWSSPMRIYQEKIGEIPPPEESEAMYWGNVLEDIVAKEFAKRTGMRIRRRNAILSHPEHDWALANVDRLIVGKKEGLECKTTNAFAKSDWTQESVPDQYFLQCQWYMAVTGYKKWHLAVLIGGNDFKIHEINRDDELINTLIEKGKEFWFDHVIPQNPPAFDGSSASDELLRIMYPESEKDTQIELPSEFEAELAKLEEIKEQINILTNEKKGVENRIKGHMGENEKAVLNEFRISWKSYNSMNFDTKSFKKDHPDLYEKYAKSQSRRRFTISS